MNAQKWNEEYWFMKQQRLNPDERVGMDNFQTPGMTHPLPSNGTVNESIIYGMCTLGMIDGSSVDKIIKKMLANFEGKRVKITIKTTD